MDKEYIPKIGDVFTISINNRVRDRSYTDDLLQCTGKNENLIQAKIIDSLWSKREIRLLVEEHRFFKQGSLKRIPSDAEIENKKQAIKS